MESWIVETLSLVRRYAAEHGLENLTDEMDIALLVAVEDMGRKSGASRGRLDGIETNRDRGEVVVYPRSVRIGRYH